VPPFRRELYANMADRGIFCFFLGSFRRGGPNPFAEFFFLCFFFFFWVFFFFGRVFFLVVLFFSGDLTARVGLLAENSPGGGILEEVILNSELLLSGLTICPSLESSLRCERGFFRFRGIRIPPPFH